MAAAIARRQVSSFVRDALGRENRGITYGVAAGVCMFAVVCRMFYIGNALGLGLLIVSVICWLVVWMLLDGFKAKLLQKREVRTRICRFAQIVSGFGLISLFYASPMGQVWVIPERAETSISRSILWMPVFATPEYFSVTPDHGATISIDVVTKDEVPLQCSVIANNIFLDYRDTRPLETLLLGVAATRDPNQYLNAEVQATLATAAGTVLRGRTTEEISRQGRFLIPYRIGTPMGNMLSRNSLRWQDGTVSFRCELRKFQS